MPIHNPDIAAVFSEIADLLEIEGDNPFRIRAYRNAARTIQDHGRGFVTMVSGDEDLTAIPGIGKDLAARIKEVVETGTTGTLENLRKKLPPGIADLLRIQGLGPKRVGVLYKELNIGSLDQLREAAEAGRIRVLAGFGEKTEKKILESIHARADAGARFLRASAEPYAESIVAYLKEIPGVREVVLAGSYRRARETVGDLDVLVTGGESGVVMDRFTAFDEVKEVLARGPTKSSVILRPGLQVDLRMVEPASFGAALNYFTGSKAHNIALRRLGQQRGLKINEYGVFEDERPVGGATEEEVYRSVGLAWIPPELREDRGEIEAAREGRLPRLVEYENLRGDLHSHTTASDGKSTIEEMAIGARARGFEYLAITEHSKRLTVAGGLDEDELAKQVDEIDRINETLEGFTLLKGIEVDILEDGSLDLPDSILRRLDLVIGSVHTHFNLGGEKQTERILRAMDRPCFTMMGHLTGRLLLQRNGYDVDVPRIIRHAKERGCFIELNSHPQRLDLTDIHCTAAREEGVLVSVNSDAHTMNDFDVLHFGIGQARRGWLEKKDVLNTRPLNSLRPLLAGTMGK